MTVLITTNMLELYDGDTATGWSPAPGTNSVDKLEGSNCLADQVKSTTGSVYLFTLASAIDMTDKFMVLTMKVNGVANTKANGGYRIVLEDSTTAQATWYVGGNDTHPGGWGYFALDPSTSPTSGSVDYTDILKVGVQFDTLTSVVGTADNCFWDIAHYGTGLTVTSAATETGGSGTGGATGWEDIYDYDTGTNPHYYGIVQKVNGVYFIRGNLVFGSTTTLSIDFDDDALVGFQPDEFMTDNVSAITIDGNATGSTNVNIPNSVLFSTLRKYEFDISDTDIDTTELPSTTVQLTAVSDISAGDYIGTAFDTCEQLTVGSGTFTGCVIRNSPSTIGAILLANPHNISDQAFISAGTGYGILITASGNYTFDNFTFDDYATVNGSTGNECVYNNSGGLVTITITNGGDTPTYRNGTSATTVVNNAVNISIHVEDASGSDIQGVQVAVYKTSDDTELLNTDTDSNGDAGTTFNYVSNTDIYLRIRKSSTGATRYLPFNTTGTIYSTGFTLGIILYEDTIVT